MTTPTLRQLDIFAQLVASGSITECAATLDISTADLLRDMAALEDRLGHQLFDMQGGSAQLTDAGRTTVSAMQRLSETDLEQWETPTPAVITSAESDPAEPLVIDDVPAPISAPIRPFRQQVMIAAHPAIFGHFQDALDAFEQANADVAITLDLDTHTAAQAGPLLARGSADIAYYYALGEDGLNSRYAWSEPLALYIGEAHPLSAADTVDFDDLDLVQPITLMPTNSLRRLIEQALDKAGIAGRPPTMESDNLFAIMTAVRKGEGYFAAFGPLARDFARMVGIKRLPLAMPLPAIDVRQAVRAEMRDDPVIASLAEYLFR